uniref:Putative non-structural polyprotein n=1 Tax=Solenopsis invicta virus 6 TaxID=2547312 RepID=A0A482CL22_9VIRU|nr:putative non-structural polyprotein [Solenopsis invicta virus 6]
MWNEELDLDSARVNLIRALASLQEYPSGLRQSTSSTQTELSIRDKFSSDPSVLLQQAMYNFYMRIKWVDLTTADIKMVACCFPRSDLLNWNSPTLGVLISDYLFEVRKLDGLSTAWDECHEIHNLVSLDLPRLCQVFKKKSPYMNSTLPEVCWNYWKNKSYAFDVVRELKFFRQHINGLEYDPTNYYLFLESENIPIAKILAHPRVKAQVGIDINVNHKCPDIVKFLESPLFQKLTIVAENFTTDTFERIKTRIIAISTVIYNLSRWSMKKLSTTDLIVNLTSSLAICIPISTMTEFFTRIFAPSAQAGSELNIRQILKAFFLCLFVLIVGKLPGKHTVDEFINRIHKFPCAFESIQKFWKLIDPITDTATNYIESELLGYDVIEEKTIMDEVQQWAKLVEEYSDLYKKREIMKDKETMLTAGRIHVDGVRLLSKCMRLHYSRENIELVRSLLPTTYKISEIAIRSGADHSKPRREPLIVWFCGQSGVGKSTMGYPFLCDMMKSELGPNETLPENWVQKIYARAPECEFWDGDPTDWIVYDDGFQIRDSIANPSPELFEIIRLGNMFPYMFHKASIEEKGNCFADVKGIVISSNIERIMAESIHCPEAVARRIRYSYKVHLRPEYRLYYTGKNGEDRLYRLDKNAVQGPSMDIYQFHPFDPLTGKETGEVLTYKQVVLQCALALRRLGDEYCSYESWLDDYRKIPFTRVVAQSGRGAGSFREYRQMRDIMELLEKYGTGRFLTNSELLRLDQFVNSERLQSRLRQAVLGENLEHYDFLIDAIKNRLSPGVFTGPQYSEQDVAEFYRDLDQYGFMSRDVKANGEVIRKVVVHPERELIKPCRFMSPFWTWQNYVMKHYLLAKLGHYKGFSDLMAAVKRDFSEDVDALKKNPIRCFAASMYETYQNITEIPYSVNALSKYYFEKDFLSWKCFEAYNIGMKDRNDRRMRFSDADFVFQTSMPYVQSGAVIEEVTEEDIQSVRGSVQRWRMACKKTLSNAWAYTQRNYPNMLLYAVGVVTATYSLYKLVYRPGEDGEVEEEIDVRAQSLDESGPSNRNQPRVRARVQNVDHSSGPHPRQTSRARVQHLDSSGPSSRPVKHSARVQAQLETDLRPEWMLKQESSEDLVQLIPSPKCRPVSEVVEPYAQGNTSSAIDHQLYSVLDSRVFANTLMAYITPRKEDSVQRRLGHIIALRGSLFMMNYHFVLVLKHYGECDVVIRQGNSVYHRCSAEELIQNYVRVSDRDLVVFEMKRKGIAFGDLVKHIQSKSTAYSHNVQTVVLARQRLAGMSVTPNLLTATDCHLHTSPISIELNLRGEATEIVNAMSWMYTGVTFDGDCGALLLISNNRVPSKIVGVHNAYDPYRGKAMAIPLYRDEIEEALNFFQPRLQYGWRDDFPLDVRALNFDQGENFNVVRCEKGSIPSNCRTRLARSPIFEELVPTLTKPGYLRPIRKEDGSILDPAVIARAKWGYHLPRQDEQMAKRVTNAVVQVFLKVHREGSERYKYPLTTEEAIVGVEGVEGLNSINKVSSPGYPYVFQKIPGRGKTGYFGEYEFDLTLPGARQIIHEVEQMELDILNNKRPFVVWMDTLKDARIPIEKAERGKTRIFSAGPMAYTILYRKYFLPPIAHTMNNRIENHIAVGINPTSPEWHTLALKLRSKGRHCIAGDYACFDGKAPTEGYLSALEFFKAWYIENWQYVTSHQCNIIENYEMSQAEFLEFLDKIFLEVVNHIHLMEYDLDGEKHHLFYSVCNGQPSGNPGTAMVNSAQGLWMVIRCWLELSKGSTYHTVSQFFEHVYMIDYGDDVAMNISSEAIMWFNQNTLTKCMKRLFDIDFTDEKKTGEVGPDSRELSEITFLKRSFIWNDEIQMYVCPMEVHTLLDILNWVRTGAEDPRIITINNISSVAAELALVSQEAFDEWLPRLKRVYSQLAWRANKEIYFDTRYGYLLSFRNALFKSVTPD